MAKPTNFVSKSFSFLLSIYTLIVFVVLMFLLMPFFLIAFLLPSPKDGNAVHQISYFWAKALFFMIGIRYRAIYKSRPEKGRSYIFVTNHISYLDIPMMLMITHGFPVRILGKAEMSRIPVFGWIYRTGAVTVRRDSDENRRRSVRRLKAFLSQGISILIAPEGTFNMTQKPLKFFYNGAFRIALELQIPIQPVIFPDTYDRMSYRSIFSVTSGKSRAIFLPAIETKGMCEADFEVLKKRTFDIMEREIVDLKVSWMEPR